MSESVNDLTKNVATSFEVEAQSNDRLSPVLSTNKINRRILFGRRFNRQKGKVRLLNRFQTNPAELEGESCSSQQYKARNHIEKRLRKIKLLEEERRQYYNKICESQVNEQKSEDTFMKHLPMGLSSKWDSNSTSSKNEMRECQNGDRGISSSASTVDTPTDKSLNLPPIVKEQSEFYDALNSKMRENSVPMKNQRLSKIPRPNKTPMKNTNQQGDCLKVTDFQSASGKEIAVSESELLATKAVFSEEDLNDVLELSSGSILIVTESISNAAKCEKISQIRPTTSSPVIGRESKEANNSFSNCTVEGRLVLENSISQSKYFNGVSDTQVVTAVDNALSVMEFCSDDWAENFCKIVEHEKDMEPAGKEECENYASSTQETNLYFKDVTLHQNLMAENREPQKNLNEITDEVSNEVTSKSIVNVNIPPNVPVNYHTLCAKNLVELHRNKNFLGNSEESVHASSNINCNISQHGVEVQQRRKTVKTKSMRLKCEGFCECERVEAQERSIKMIKFIENHEAQLQDIERCTKFKRTNKNREEEERVKKEPEHFAENITESEHPNVATKKDIMGGDDKSKMRKKGKSHRGKDVPKESKLYAMKKTKRDCKEPNSSSYRERKISDDKSVGEPSPTQKRIKIEIDYSNKWRINISCNTPSQSENAVLKDTIEGTCNKNGSVSGNDGHQKSADAVLVNKLHDEDPPDYCSLDVNSAKKRMFKKIGKELDKVTECYSSCTADKEITPHVDEGKIGFKGASRRQIKITEGALRKKEHRFEDVNSNSLRRSRLRETVVGLNTTKTCGFVSASGKSIGISEDAFKKAEEAFREIEKLKDDGYFTGINSSMLKKNEYENQKGDSNGDCSGAMKSVFEEIKTGNVGLNPPKAYGFESASGKSIRFSKDGIKKAEAAFREIASNSDVYFIRINSSKSEKKGYNNQKDDSNGDHSLKSAFEEVKTGCVGVNPPKTCGFISASGKSIKLSEDAIRKAEQDFREIEKLKATNPEGYFTGINPTKPEKKGSNNRKDDSSANYNNVLQTNIDEVRMSNVGLNPPRTYGFMSASGKSIGFSKDAIKKAEQAFREIEKLKATNPGGYFTEINTSEPENKTNNNEKDYSNGDYSSGEKDSSLKNVQQFYLQSDNFSMGDFEQPKTSDKSKRDDATESPDASRKAFELLEDVVVTVDNALEKITKSSSKKRLGMARCKQIPISKERLDQAKLLFENLEGITTPNISTPIKSESKQILANTELSPIAVTKSNEELASIILRNPTEGSIDKWQEEISKQIVELRRKLEVLGERKLGLEIQKDSLEFGDKEHRRQRLGVLFTSKQDAKKRLPLKSLQWSDDDGGALSETVLEVTPRNAECLHFNYARRFRSSGRENACVQATADGAMVIPSPINLVGLSEIEVAFKTMAGVEPGLIPHGWIANHYKLIAWKLAGYERAFRQRLEGSLCVENIIQQLKYRYDREIDRAERSALRKILEKDDVSQKRMVLCVSDVYKVDANRIELELTDGWYFVKASVDEPLSKQVQKQRIRVGTKLIMQMAELLNCEGCHPLQAEDSVRLRIGYNCTRRAVWHAKLGYQRCPEPFVISMKTVHPAGGMVACLKMYVARVYPIRYLEQVGGGKIWRNEKAEEKRAREFGNEQLEKMERIHYDVEKEYNREIKLENDDSSKVSRANLSKIGCSKTLYSLMETSNDPDSLMETLSTSQRIAVLEYRQKMSLQRQQEISHRISEQVEKLKLTKRKVVPILKLLVLDAGDEQERAYQFYIWNPTEEHLHMLKEDSIFLGYNITPRFNGDLFSNSKTYFKMVKSISAGHSKTKRQLYPIAMVQDPYYKPFFNEFDTVGLVVQVNGTGNEQELWLGDFIGRVLYVKIKDSPKVCCLLDGISRGEIVSLSNLMYCQPQRNFAQAIANQFTVISRYSQQKFLQEGIEAFKMQTPKDLTKLLNDCDNLIAKCRANFHPNSGNISEVIDDSSEDNSVIPTRLTTTDIAMSLIDTQQFY